MWDCLKLIICDLHQNCFQTVKNLLLQILVVKKSMLLTILYTRLYLNPKEQSQHYKNWQYCHKIYILLDTIFCRLLSCAV